MNSFEKLNSEMFYNILINNPDSIVLDFCYKYFPSYTSKEKSNYIMKPIDSIVQSEILYTEHSILLKQHSLFENFKTLKLILHCIEDNDYLPRIIGYKIRVMYGTYEGLDMALIELERLYKQTSAKQIIRLAKRFEFVSEENYWNRIEFFDVGNNTIEVLFGEH